MSEKEITQEVKNVKLKLGIAEDDDSQDDLIILLLSEASSEVLGYTNRKTILPDMLPIVRDIAVIRYNQMGVEGELSRAEGGVSRSFADDIPKALKHRLNNYRLGKVRRF